MGPWRIFDFFAPLKTYFKKKSHHVSRLTIGYLWGEYEKFWFFIMCHDWLGISGHFLLISTLSFGEIFSYFVTSWKWYCLTFWIGEKSRLFRRFFQYSVICHFSKYIRLALTDFHENKVFYWKCMWLQLCQVLKKFTEGNARKFTVSFAFCAHVDVIKIEKHWCFSLSVRRLFELS